MRYISILVVVIGFGAVSGPLHASPANDQNSVTSRFDCRTDECFERFNKKDRQAASDEGQQEGRSAAEKPTASMDDCKKIVADADRLKCFDAVVQAQTTPSAIKASLTTGKVGDEIAKAPAPTSKPVAEDREAELKARAKGIADGTILVLNANDLAAQTKKWENKTIITRLRCFYADLDDFRCINGFGAGRVDFTTLEPEARRNQIQKDCDTMSKATADRCWIRVEFVYDHYDDLETGGLVGSIVVVQPKEGAGKIIADEPGRTAVRRSGRRW